MSPTKRKFSASDLSPGQSYQVIAAFKDYDGITHPVGEYWHLQWRPESQAQIIDNFSDFVVEI